MTTDQIKILKIFHTLRKVLKPELPVRIKFVHPKSIKGCDGYCIKNKEYFEIQIGKNEYITMFFVLLHELAHTLKFEQDEHNSYHGEAWGKAYAEVWRAYAGEFGSTNERSSSEV